MHQYWQTDFEATQLRWCISSQLSRLWVVFVNAHSDQLTCNRQCRPECYTIIKLTLFVCWAVYKYYFTRGDTLDLICELKEEMRMGAGTLWPQVSPLRGRGNRIEDLQYFSDKSPDVSAFITQISVIALPTGVDHVLALSNLWPKGANCCNNMNSLNSKRPTEGQDDEI